MKLSLFLTLPPTLQAELGLLRGSLDDVHWTPAERSLIPLQHLGRITSRPEMEELDMALSRLHWEPFSLTLHQVGHQMGETEDRLTVGVTPQQPLVALQKRLASALRRAGFPPPRRPAVPELTIGRLPPASPTDLIPWIQRHNLFHSSSMTVDHVSLMEVIPAGNEKQYRLLETYPARPDLTIPDGMSFYDDEEEEDGGA